MTKKPDAPEVKKKPPEVEKKEKVRTTKPASNPFVQAHPGRPGRSANGGQPGRRGR